MVISFGFSKTGHELEAHVKLGVRPSRGAHGTNVLLASRSGSELLKETRGMPSWSLKDLAKSLKISARAAKRAAALLEVQGYIERTGNNEWLTTDSGTAVSGSKPPRFTQEAVESALAALAERIKAVNQQPEEPFRVAKAAAFGDFLSDRARVQAPDVGIQLVPREAEGDQANLSGQAARNRFLKQFERQDGNCVPPAIRGVDEQTSTLLRKDWVMRI